MHATFQYERLLPHQKFGELRLMITDNLYYADNKKESGSVGDDEAISYFQPSAAENLKTGYLPTICSMEDIKVS